MPPKRPNKRGGDDNERPRKRGAKGKEAPSYDTYDSALDGGVEMEEKGERYRDGEKSQRFYERALELYQKAAGYQEAFDAVYNQARVYYTLASSFSLPPTSLDLLRRSIKGYTRACELVESPLLVLDASYNLAQSLIDLAELIDETASPAGEEVQAEVTKLRLEADSHLRTVMAGQAEYLREERSRQASLTDGEQDTEMQVDSESTGMEVEDGRAGSPAGSASSSSSSSPASFETYLPTPSTYIDTILLLVDLHLTIWAAATPTVLPTVDQQNAVREILDQASEFVPTGRQGDLDLAEIKVLLAHDAIVWDLCRAEAKVNTGIERSLDGAVLAVTRVLENLDTTPSSESTTRADVLTTLAEIHTTIADRMRYLIPQLAPGPSPLAQQAWFNYSQSITHLTKALELPTSAQTPREFKPSVLLGLSRASLSRAMLGEVNDTAKRNAGQLLENATTYAARALDGLGWKLVPAPGSSSGMSLSIGGGATIGLAPLPSGWDSESLAKEIILHLLRVYIIGTVAPEYRAKYASATMDILPKLKSLGARGISKKDVTEYVEELQEAGQQLGHIELDSWGVLVDTL